MPSCEIGRHKGLKSIQTKVPLIISTLFDKIEQCSSSVVGRMTKCFTTLEVERY